jgi:hypothetical protein
MKWDGTDALTIFGKDQGFTIGFEFDAATVNVETGHFSDSSEDHESTGVHRLGAAKATDFLARVELENMSAVVTFIEAFGKATADIA